MPTTAPKPLTEEQIERFYVDGYIVAPQLVPHAAIEAVMKEARADRTN